MTRSALAKTIALLAVAVIAMPASAALAQSPSGGATSPSGGTSGSSGSSTSSGSTGSTGPTGPQSTAPTAPPAPTVILAGGAVSLRLQASTYLGQALAITGRAPRRDARRTVVIQRFDAHRLAWVIAASTVTDSTGAFQARWSTNQTGRVPLRAVVIGASAAARGRTSGAGDASNSAHVTVYRPAVATYFGPGFYGQQTACGETMSRDLVGVANRTLPCGTLVEVSYGGRRLTVPVVDRGPYANGADWDLTSAAAEALGITETVHIGTIVVGREPPGAYTGSPSSSSSSPSSSPSGGSSPGATGGAASA